MFKLPIFVDFSACEVSVKRRCLVSGDYNSTELEFSFDKEYEGTKVFEMKAPNGELRMVKTITDNKIVLVGDNGASLFDEAGRYIFEISLYNGDSKLTSSSGFLLVDKEQVVIDGEIVEPFLPAFDELLNSVSEALEETSNLNIEAVKIGKTTTVTFTDKEGNTKEIEIKDGEDLPEYTFGNGLSKVGNNISVNTSTIATVNEATQLANSAYEDALADVEGEATIRELKDAETLASAKSFATSSIDSRSAILNARIDGKQDNLVSGTNIKTINGNNILGSGNIEIQGGGGSSYTFTDGVSESGGTVSADMEYIESALYDSIGEIVDMTGTPRNNQILIGASNITPTIKASGKTLSDLQDKLVSGTNIKTINGESILGSGDLTIGGGSSGWELISSTPILEEVGTFEVNFGKAYKEVRFVFTSQGNTGVQKFLAYFSGGNTSVIQLGSSRPINVYDLWVARSVKKTFGKNYTPYIVGIDSGTSWVLGTNDGICDTDLISSFKLVGNSGGVLKANSLIELWGRN